MPNTSTPNHATCQEGFVLSGDRSPFYPVDSGPRVDPTASSRPATDAPQRFRKDLIALGTYHHPVHGWTLEVTMQRLRQWLSAFERMRQNGVDVEVTVDHQAGAKAVQGYVVDMFIQDGRLFGIHEMRSPEAVALARRVKNVSIEIEPDYVDGRGWRYGEAIVRSSLVQQPVVPDQQAFVPLAASRSGRLRQRPHFVLAAAPGALPMDFLTELAGILEISDAQSLTESNWQQTLRDRLGEQAQALTQARKQLSLADQRLTTLQADLKQRLALPAIDADVLEELAEASSLKLSRLVEQGCITPAVHDQLQAILLGREGQRSAILLSRSAARAVGFDKAVTQLVLDALEHNDPVKLGEQTRHQAVALSRQTPGQPSPPVDPATQQRMTQAAYGPAA